jgi:1-acyl-sn-glycerol-3-phosphate acyltransferase
VRPFFIGAARPLVRGAARLYFGLTLRGTEHAPPAGPVLITPNHQTYADPALVTLPIRRPVYYMAWDRLFTVPFFGWLIRTMRAFPVDIDATDLRATRRAMRLLQAGAAVMIFPEGSRSLDGAVGHFKPGAFRLAVARSVPVLPVTITGGYELWPPSRTLPRPGRITVIYHPLQRADPTLPPRVAAQELADRVRAVIAGALGAERWSAAVDSPRGRS